MTLKTKSGHDQDANFVEPGFFLQPPLVLKNYCLLKSADFTFIYANLSTCMYRVYTYIDVYTYAHAHCTNRQINRWLCDWLCFAWQVLSGALTAISLLDLIRAIVNISHDDELPNYTWISPTIDVVTYVSITNSISIDRIKSYLPSSSFSTGSCIAIVTIIITDDYYDDGDIIIIGSSSVHKRLVRRIDVSVEMRFILFWIFIDRKGASYRETKLLPDSKEP